MVFVRRFAIVLFPAVVLASVACSSATTGGPSPTSGLPSGPTKTQRVTPTPTSEPSPEPEIPHLPPDAARASVGQADIDGDGRPDSTLLYVARNPRRWILRVVLATGEKTQRIIGEGDDPFTPELAICSAGCEIEALHNADGKPGAEIFLFLQHITTWNTIGVYKLAGDQIVYSGAFMSDGGDMTYNHGYTCTRIEGQPVIVQHSFSRNHSYSRHWTQENQIFKWRGAKLVESGPSATGTLTTPSASGGSWPPKHITGGHCP